MITPVRARVLWTDAEQKSVFAAAAALGQPVMGDSADTFRRMQEHLPTDRRRRYDPALMAQVNAHRRNHGAPVPAKLVLNKQAKVEQQLAELTATWDDVELPVSVPPSVTDSLATKAAGLITAVVLEVLYSPEVRAAARDLIKEVLAPEVQAKVEQGVLWKDKLPGQSRKRVVIASGGKAALAFEHLKPLQRFYDIRTWNAAEANPARLRAILASADVAVIHASSISHSGSNTVRDWGKANKERKVIMFNRNIAQLAEELPALLGDSLKMESVA